MERERIDRLREMPGAGDVDDVRDLVMYIDELEKDDDRFRICPVCGGDGKHRYVHGEIDNEKPCGTCKGTGRIRR